MMLLTPAPVRMAVLQAVILDLSAKSGANNTRLARPSCCYRPCKAISTVYSLLCESYVHYTSPTTWQICKVILRWRHRCKEARLMRQPLFPGWPHSCSLLAHVWSPCPSNRDRTSFHMHATSLVVWPRTFHQTFRRSQRIMQTPLEIDSVATSDSDRQQRCLGVLSLEALPIHMPKQIVRARLPSQCTGLSPKACMQAAVMLLIPAPSLSVQFLFWVFFAGLLRPQCWHLYAVFLPLPASHLSTLMRPLLSPAA